MPRVWRNPCGDRLARRALGGRDAGQCSFCRRGDFWRALVVVGRHAGAFSAGERIADLSNPALVFVACFSGFGGVLGRKESSLL